jgi:hypothetical protein
VAEFPDHPHHQTNLGAYYGNLGNIVRDQDEPAAALAWYGVTWIFPKGWPRSRPS